MRRLRLQFALLAALVGLLLVAGAFAAFDSAGSAGTASATITVTLSPVADAYTEQGAPGRNYGAATTLWSDGSPLSNAYLRFDASSVGTITSAKLRFYVGDGTSDGPLVYETDSAWSEATLDWATNPATRGAALANLGSVAAGGYVEVDVSSVLTSGRQVSFGLLPESSDGLGLDSREAAFPPQLVLTASTVSLSPVADAYTEQGAPGRNYGAATTLWSDGSPLSNAYLRFDASSVGTITNAKLRFYVSDATSDGPLVYETDSAWSEATLNWNTNPATRGAALANLGSVAAGGYVDVDVPSVLTSGRQVSFGLLPESSDGLGLGSREAAFPPQLVLTASADTTPPTAPSGLAATASQTAATLSWNASADDVGVSGYRLFLNGSQVATATGLSYSFSGLSCGTSYAFGVAAYDAAGNQSTTATMSATTAACGSATSTVTL